MASCSEEVSTELRVDKSSAALSHRGTAELLIKLAPGQVKNCPFSASSVQYLKMSIAVELDHGRRRLGRHAGDNEDVIVVKNNILKHFICIGSTHCY